MISVSMRGDVVNVCMAGVDYRFTDAQSAEAFKALMDTTTNMTALVERFLNHLERAVKRVSREIVRLARMLADSDNYWRGRGAANYQDVNRYIA